MEIIPGVHRIDGVKGANCYLVILGEKLLLIDTGMPSSGDKITNYIKEIGKQPSDISYILLTHAHLDHIGSAAETKKVTGAKVAIHTANASILRGKSELNPIEGPFGFISRLMTQLIHFQAVEPDIILENDIEIEGFKIIHTPGHTGGSVCIYQPGKVIFAGDALRSDSRGNPIPPAKGFSTNLVQANVSLGFIASLEFDTLLTGHGAPVVGKASVKLKTLVTKTKLDN